MEHPNMNENLDFTRPSAAAEGRVAENEFAGIERRTLDTIREEYSKLTSEILDLDGKINRTVEDALANPKLQEVYTALGKEFGAELATKRSRLAELREEGLALGGDQAEFKDVPVTH
jgi:predicted  nucleic acid-binding Zn-ribbon protein